MIRKLYFSTSLLSHAIIFSVIVICISSCDSCKTKPDFQDKTAPEISWIITTPSGQQDTITGSGNTAISNGEGLHVMAVVKDEGGIVEVTTSQEAAWDCLGDVLAQPAYGPNEQTMTLSLDSGGGALQIFPIGFDVNTFFVCPKDLDFKQGNITLKCAALNFGNLKTEVVLAIHVNPKF
jgi:hypothetical protein